MLFFLAKVVHICTFVRIKQSVHTKYIFIVEDGIYT